MSDDVEIIELTSSSEEDEIEDQKPDIKKIRLSKQNADVKNYFAGGRDIVLKHKTMSEKRELLLKKNQTVRLIPGSKDESFLKSDPRYFIVNDNESKMEVWMSDFSIFDKNNCMRSLDLKKETDQYMINGIVKPIANDFEGLAIKTGPIDQFWWISGYSPGESIIITVTTNMVIYHLEMPVEEYKAYFHQTLEKAYYVKFFVEILYYRANSKAEANVEDLINRIKLSHVHFPREYCKPSLKRLRDSSKFILERLENYDENGDDDEDHMLDSDLIQHLKEWIEEDDNLKRSIKKPSLPHETTPIVYGSFSGNFSRSEINPCLTKSDKKKLITIEDPDVMVIDEVLTGNGKEHEEVKPPCWIGDPIHSSQNCTTYNSVFYKNNEFSVNDYITINPRTNNEIFSVGRINKLFSKNGENMMHVEFFRWAKTIVKRKPYDNKELLLVGDCEDVQISTLRDKTQVIFKSFDSNWKNAGGLEIEKSSVFFCQKWYDEKQSRFTDIKTEKKSNCLSCDYKSAEKEYETPKFCEISNSVMWKGIKYKVNDYVLVNQPCILSPKRTLEKPRKNCRRYPELIRKPTTCPKMSSHSLFTIGRIKQFYEISSNSDNENIKVELQLFHRSEDETDDLNYLYYTEEVKPVEFKKVEGKCRVFYGKPKNNELITPDLPAFYFLKVINIPQQTISPEILQKVCFAMGYKKVELPTDFNPSSKDQVFKSDFKLKKKLKGLDLFCGCGGLSEGFKMAGLVEIKYAVDKNRKAAKAFELNNPGAVVFNINCSDFVELLQKGKSCYDKTGKPFPKKGDVQIILAGPPCQGFSGLNRFPDTQQSRSKNASIATFFSVVDIFRPEFFILENVNFASCYSEILRTIIDTGLEIGYQLAFGLLTSGNYGVPQKRTRLFVFGAAPGKKLPLFPEPIFAFKSSNPWPTIKINGNKCNTNIKRKLSVQFRSITVADAINDLPIIENGDGSTHYGEPKTHYQRLMRKNCLDGELKYHVCKELDPLQLKRVELIPKLDLNSDGRISDWRDLPNTRIQLSNGDITEKLQYGHSHKGLIGQKRNCIPVPLVPENSNTIIPYTLCCSAVHNNHWKFAYGRLAWDSTFDTVTTTQNLEKKVRIIHPDQDRVLSIREYARAQGFCDNFQFYGGPADQLKQIGNAVPVPLAKAIAIEFLKVQF